MPVLEVVLVEVEGTGRGSPGRAGEDRPRPLLRSLRLGLGLPMGDLVLFEEMLVEPLEDPLGRGTSGRLGGDPLGFGPSTGDTL